jgi:hypothetical protein
MIYVINHSHHHLLHLRGLKKRSRSKLFYHFFVFAENQVEEKKQGAFFFFLLISLCN